MNYKQSYIRDMYSSTEVDNMEKASFVNDVNWKKRTVDGIEYRDPDYNCDRLYNEGEVRPRSLQNYMGHTQISMTEHYISRCNSHEDDDDKARACLSYK